MSQMPIFPGPPPPFAPRRWVWIGSVVTAWVFGAGVGFSVAAGADDPASAGAVEAVESTTARPTSTQPTKTTTTPPTTQPQTPPEAGDFKIAITILEKQCFGSAGCLVTFRITPSYEGSVPLDGSATYTVVYEISGGQEPQVNRFTITGDTASFPAEESIDTASSSAKLAAKATSVLEG